MAMGRAMRVYVTEDPRTTTAGQGYLTAVGPGYAPPSLVVMPAALSFYQGAATMGSMAVTNWGAGTLFLATGW